MSILRRLLGQAEQPSDAPAEVVDRLMRYERERQQRFAEYREAWGRKFAAQGVAVDRRAQLWRIK